MYSVVVSVVDSIKFGRVLVPSLDRIKEYLRFFGLPELDLIVINGTDSLTKNYNEGMKRSKYKVKFFVHEDVDLMDNGIKPLFVRVDELFKEFPETGLVGLVGTTGFSNVWWWEVPKETIVGQVLLRDQHIAWNTDKEIFSGIRFIDGMFMATNTEVEFSEDVKGFHLYDNDYCNKMREDEYEIKVVNHMVRHEATARDVTCVDFTHYKKKWNL
jgi:hypothetical protein